jgi:uncharacterized protein (TIGR02996 family)
MTENPAFLEAILEAPNDDGPRLVYADWLEERGDADRAEIIRVQCGLARLRYDDDRVSDLQAREYRLLSRHFTAWCDGYDHVRVRRGFIEQVDYWTPARFTEAAARLFARHPVRDVDIWAEGEPGWGRLVADCPQLRRLEILRLPRMSMSDRFTDFTDLLAVLSSPHLTGLTTLDAGGGHGYGDDALLELLGVPGRERLGRSDDGLLPSLRGLRRLSLSGMGLNDRGLRALAGSPLADTLTHLDLSNHFRVRTNSTGLTSDGMRALIDSPLWPRLEELNLGRLRARDGSALRLLADALPRSRLTKLGLSGALHPDARRQDVAEALAGAASWGNLQALDLSFNRLSGRGVRILAGCPHLAGLRWLSFAETDLGQTDFERLADCPLLTNLTGLRLGNPHLGDAGLEALAHSDHLKRLVYLDVAGGQVRGAGVAAFARSPNAARVRVWLLPSSVGDGGLKAIARSQYLGRLTTLVFGGMATRGSPDQSRGRGPGTVREPAQPRRRGLAIPEWERVRSWPSSAAGVCAARLARLVKAPVRGAAAGLRESVRTLRLR